MKIAIVASEGGMCSVYGGGVILALVKRYRLTDPFLVISSSGNTGALAYFVSRQYDAIQELPDKFLHDEKFINTLRPSRIVDVDYLVDVIFSKKVPLDIKTLKESKTLFLIGTTCLNTGIPTYFSNHDSNVNVIDALRASYALPLIYGKSIDINGQRYIDGAMSADFVTNINKALEMGAEKVIAIDCRGEGYSLILNSLFLFLTLFRGSVFRKSMNHFLKRQPYMGNDERVILIKPTKPLIAKNLCNKRSELMDSFNLGMEDVATNEGLARMFAQ